MTDVEFDALVAKIAATGTKYPRFLSPAFQRAHQRKWAAFFLARALGWHR